MSTPPAETIVVADSSLYVVSDIRRQQLMLYSNSLFLAGVTLNAVFKVLLMSTRHQEVSFGLHKRVLDKTFYPREQFTS